MKLLTKVTHLKIRTVLTGCCFEGDDLMKWIILHKDFEITERGKEKTSWPLVL